MIDPVLFEDRKARCCNCKNRVWVPVDDRLRDKWACYGCGRINRFSETAVVKTNQEGS